MPRRLGRAIVTATLVALALGIYAAVAHADGDPASDVLPTNFAFFPTGRSAPDENTADRLLDLLDAAAARDRPFKVALIPDPTYMGSVGALWGKPEQYAVFLAREISNYVTDATTLVTVMPQGVGLAGPGASARSEAAAVATTLPAHASSTQLTEAAIAAVRAAGIADGHPLPAERTTPRARRAAPTSASSGGTATWLVVLLAVVPVGALVIGGMALSARTDRPQR